jgi:hypothetical protein
LAGSVQRAHHPSSYQNQTNFFQITLIMLPAQAPKTCSYSKRQCPCLHTYTPPDLYVGIHAEIPTPSGLHAPTRPSGLHTYTWVYTPTRLHAHTLPCLPVPARFSPRSQFSIVRAGHSTCTQYNCLGSTEYRQGYNCLGR